MHILDKMVTDVLHQIFRKMRDVEESEIVSRTHRNAMIGIKERLATAKAECAKANKEYESLKAEVLKAVQGQSAFPMDLLSEMVNSAKAKVLETSEQVTALTQELNESEQKVEGIKREYQQILTWGKMFDESDIAVKKMIAGYIIKRVDVYSDYRLHFTFNITFAQFELGLDFPDEVSAEQIAS